MRVAFLTLEDRGPFVIDDSLAVEALAHRGCQVDEIPWRHELIEPSLYFREDACAAARFADALLEFSQT